MSVTAAARALQVFGGNLARSSADEAMAVALLEIMDANGVPGDSATPIRDCIKYVEDHCTPNAATVRFAQMLNSKREIQG